MSEHASWSTQYYGRIISAALAAVGALRCPLLASMRHGDQSHQAQMCRTVATRTVSGASQQHGNTSSQSGTALDAQHGTCAGAPEGLVQIVTGYGETGAALVRSGLGKLVFVGSTEVGRRVVAASAETLTPVTMELGGKDAFIVTDDVDLRQVRRWQSYSLTCLMRLCIILRITAATGDVLRSYLGACCPAGASGVRAPKTGTPFAEMDLMLAGRSDGAAGVLPELRAELRRRRAPHRASRSVR